MPARSRVWHLDAACVGAPDGLFYGPEGEKPPERLAREARALEFCAACPVLDPCRMHALALPETYGVWGGTTEANRNAVRRGRITASALPMPGPVRVSARASSLPASESAAVTVRTSLPHRCEQGGDVDGREADPGVARAVGKPKCPCV